MEKEEFLRQYPALSNTYDKFFAEAGPRVFETPGLSPLLKKLNDDIVVCKPVAEVLESSLDTLNTLIGFYYERNPPKKPEDIEKLASLTLSFLLGVKNDYSSACK